LAYVRTLPLVALVVVGFGCSPTPIDAPARPENQTDASNEDRDLGPPKSDADTPTPTTDAAPDASGPALDANVSAADTTPGQPGDAGAGEIAMDAAASDAVSVRCQPTAGAPIWVEEGTPVRATLRCATGLALEPEAFALAPLPPGASYDPRTATFSWTPRLDQAAVYLLPLSVPASGETGTLKIGVADKFDDPSNHPIADATTYTEELGLPVLHLETAPNINRDVYTPATVVYRAHRYTAEAQYRGASSFRYPKKNFTLRFAKTDKFTEPLLGDGFINRRKISLITTFDDNSYVRARMAFRLWQRMDEGNIAVRAFSAVVYLNGRFHGLYTVADKIDGNLMQLHGLPEDGNLFMAINHDANFAPFFYNEPVPQDETRKKPAFTMGYEKKEGLPAEGQPGALDDIGALSQFIATADDTTFRTGIAERLALRDYINWLVHSTTIQAWDTLAKNAFHYHDPRPGGRWRVTPWDFNESFGQTWETARFPGMVAPKDVIFQPTGGFGYTNRDFLWRRLWNDPSHASVIRARFAEVLRGTLAQDKVLAWFDAMVAETSASAKRDERLWAAPYRAFYKGRTDFTSYEQEVAYVRKWIADRWAFLTALY
jgi:spore coat protein H